MRQLVLAIILTIPRIVGGGEDGKSGLVPVFVDVERPADWQYGPTFADTAGQLWHTSPDALFKWDGKSRSWQKTPVVVAPRPRWDARPVPPWHRWACPPCVIPGENGYLLAVVVNDIFQKRARERAEENPDWRTLDELELQSAVKGQSPYWLDSWLYRDGKWSEKRALVDLLKSEREVFVKHFTQQTPTTTFFDLQAVGSDLWWYDGTAVQVLERTGRQSTWDLPKKEEKGQVDRLRSANLVLLADGTLWYVEGLCVMSLKLVRGVIETNPEPQANLPLRYATDNYCIHMTRDGHVWMSYLPTMYSREAVSFLLSDGKWTKVEGAGQFALEDPVGGAWFLPGQDYWSPKKAYHILKGNRHLRLPLPGSPLLGMISPAGKNRLLACCGDRVVILVRSNEEPGWTVQSVLGLRGIKEHTLEHMPFWLDGVGNLVGGAGWVARLPEDVLP